ncbi:lipopolysaccharide transport periplasmic protein LptA [Colwellia sp. UCD-KL20]|uniref:lipopolysaccharide transport periplasmic protein LptA n=1 Tax=Colwellia sp. UCD-KL20 TaxID=1917165 RepID=UPI0009710F6F|nr:lipopolysaccharide transport periplasmic protein LptA [Colwellia sp. UCD-KL20]
MCKQFTKKLKNSLLLLLLSSLASTSALAKKVDLNQELSIDASRQSADLKNKIFSYIDNVVIQQGTLIIKADLVQVITDANTGEKTYIAKGKPATFEQTLEDGKPINLQANEIRYEPSLNTVTISGQALLKQDGSEVSGSKITYNSETEYVNAESNENDKVKTVIQPKEKSKPTLSQDSQ